MRTAESSSASLTAIGLASIGVIACAFSLDWIRQFWNSPRDLGFFVKFQGGLEYDGGQLGFRQALPCGLVGLLLICLGIAISELGISDVVAGLLLLAALPAWVMVGVVWFFGKPDRLIIPALRNRKVKDLG
jgi:hypothetical protein